VTGEPTTTGDLIETGESTMISGIVIIESMVVSKPIVISESLVIIDPVFCFSNIKLFFLYIHYTSHITHHTSYNICR
jgi:hypothetical protein